MRDIILMVIFVGLVPFIFVRPWTGVLVWSWIGYMNPHKLGWGFTHSLPVAMVFGGLTIVTMFLTKEKKGIPMTRETIVLFALCILFTISTLFAWVPDDAWMQWDKVMKIFLFTFVTIVLIYGRDRIHALFVVIALSLGFFGVKGGLFVLTTGGVNRVLGPPGSFIGGNTSLGLALVMVLPLIVMLTKQTRKKWLKRAGYAAALLTMLATVFTYSRGALLGLAATLPFIFLTTRKKGLVLLLIIPLAVVGPSLVPKKLLHKESTISTYKQDNSAMQRIQAWSVAWNVALHSPVLGGGFKLENLPNDEWLRYANFLGDWDNRARAAHSIYFQMLGEQGFTGLILFVMLLIYSFRTLSRIKKTAKSMEGQAWMAEYASAIQIALLGYAVSGAFLSLAYFDLFYAYVALTVIMQRELSLQANAVRSAPKAVMPARLGQQGMR